jgi:hypothetical protein
MSHADIIAPGDISDPVVVLPYNVFFLKFSVNALPQDDFAIDGA